MEKTSKFLSFVFCLVYGFVSFTQSIDSSKVDRLELYFNESFMKDSLKYRELFFNEFPNNFSELYDYYGSPNGVLSESSYAHINTLLGQISNVNDTILIKKIIAVSIGGYWQADGTSFFQNIVRNKIYNNLDIIYFLLNQMPNAQIRSFFYFVFDNSTSPYYKAIPKSLEAHKKEYQHVYRLMVSTMKNVEADNNW